MNLRAFKLTAGLVVFGGLAACAPSTPAPNAEILPARTPLSEPVEPIVSAADRDAAAASRAEDSSGSFTVLAVNDVYRIAGLLPSERGGLARLRTLRRTLERLGDVLFLHAGDALFPSLLSREYGGEQMIDVLNLLDGREDAWDPNMIAVFGNHEFDDNGLEDIPAFEDRMRESDFAWLRTNLDFPVKTDGEGDEVGVDEVGLHDVLKRSVLLERGGIRVGVFGLTQAVADVEYVDFKASDEELVEHMERATRELRDAGAQVVIALTHLDMPVDERVAAAADPGPDLIIGGHEHNAQNKTVNGRLILKADADALTATVATVRTGPDGVSIDARLDTIGPGTFRPDPLVHARVESWLERFERVFCRDKVNTRRCLDDPVAVLGEEAIAEEVRIRSSDTNVGRWVASLMFAAASTHVATSADVVGEEPLVAFINSGALRLNQNLLAGQMWQRRHSEELNQFPDTLHLVRISAADLQAILNHSAACRGGGPWLQVAGMTFEVDALTGTARNVHIDGVPLESITGPILAVTLGFLAREDSPGDQDGYALLPSHYVGSVVNSDGPMSLRGLIDAALESAPGGVIEFPQDVRVITPADGSPVGVCSPMDRN